MIFVGTPAVGPPTWALLDSLMSLRAGKRWQFRRQPGYGGVDVACNELVKAFLESDCEHFVLIANDAHVHPDTVGRLLSWNVDLVAALSFIRYAPIVPTVYPEFVEGVGWPFACAQIREWIAEHPELIQRDEPAVLDPRPDDALLPVRRFGTHVFAAKRKVFETIEPPWFERTRPDGGGEDFYFVGKAESAGFQPYVDRSVIAGHSMMDWCIGALDFMAWAEVTDWSIGEVRFNDPKIQGVDDNQSRRG
jgi:hypothetical protein